MENFIVIHIIKGNTYWLVEYLGSAFTHSKVSEEFALTTSIPHVECESSVDFRATAMDNNTIYKQIFNMKNEEIQKQIDALKAVKMQNLGNLQVVTLIIQQIAVLEAQKSK